MDKLSEILRLLNEMQEANAAERQHLLAELREMSPPLTSETPTSKASSPPNVAVVRDSQEGSLRCFEARSALEAMRSGVVNRAVVQHATYGRDTELAQLLGGFRKSRGGSAQVLMGQYGSGKSHLCEMLAIRAEEEGYAVARIEMGSSSNSVEHPRSLVAAIARAFAVKLQDRRLSGADDFGILLRALRPDGFRFVAEAELLQKVHRDAPGTNAVMKRFDRFKLEVPKVWAGNNSEIIPDLVSSWYHQVPTAMTAVNCAVHQLNLMAHDLALAEVPGLVLILDEAERTTESPNSHYRIERASDIIRGLSIAAGNKDTSGLKHHRNNQKPPYRGRNPSRMHVVLAFTQQWGFGLGDAIGSAVDTPPLKIEPFNHHNTEALVRPIYELYRSAHGAKVSFSAEEIIKAIRSEPNSDGTRELVRRAVAAMDHRRYHGGRKR